MLQSSLGDLDTYCLLILVVDIYLNPLYKFLFFLKITQASFYLLTYPL